MEQEEDMGQRMEQRMEQENLEQHMEQDMEQSMEQEKLEQRMEQQDKEQHMDQQDMANIATEEEKIQQLSDFLREIFTDKTIITQFVQQKRFSFENIITPTPKSELRKDISFQLPDLEGFQSCQLAHQLDFDRHNKLFIQIINRSSNDGGSHWLTISNISCMTNTIKVNDSACSDLPHEEELTIVSLVAVTADTQQVIFPNVVLQTNRCVCGLYAVANATALAYIKDPKTQVYIPRLMRSHLYKCLENSHLEPFPIISRKVKRKPHRNGVDLPLFCFCRMPDTHTLYIRGLSQKVVDFLNSRKS